MQDGLDMVAQGNAGIITLLGMGGVFIALVCLYLFTTLLGKTSKAARTRRKSAASKPPPASAGASLPAEAAPGGDELAAAVAVAMALQAGRRRPALALRTAPGGGSSWKMAGRLTLMRPPGSRGRTGRP
jgi:sodium pump decarboxylase gamma subunit